MIEFLLIFLYYYIILYYIILYATRFYTFLFDGTTNSRSLDGTDSYELQLLEISAVLEKYFFPKTIIYGKMVPALHSINYLKKKKKKRKIQKKTEEENECVFIYKKLHILLESLVWLDLHRDLMVLLEPTMNHTDHH